MNPKLFFFLLFCFQILVIFQGIELADTGFYGSFISRYLTTPSLSLIALCSGYRELSGNISEDFSLPVFGLRILWVFVFGNHRGRLPLFKEIRTY
jgi:hypothetical protein